MLKKLIKRCRNLWRLREILQVVAKYGFSYVVNRKKLVQAYAGSVQGWPQASCKPLQAALSRSPLVRVRLMFEELGPAFIKLGQLLSTRPDLIPKDLAKELSRLQDAVPPFGAAEAREQVEKELGAPPEKIFAEFDYKPLASASIGQVHRARLADGTEVVVKIQRPGLKAVIERDLAVLEDFKGLLKRSLLNKVCDVDEVITTFSRQIRKELDFTVEALCQECFREVYASHPDLVVPRVYWQYTTTEVLTMDYISGVKIDACENWYRRSPGGKRVARLFLSALVLPFFEEGIFHGDPHPGNVVFQPGERIALIDFGIVGKLDNDFRFQIAQLMLAVEERDAAKVAELTVKLGIATRPIDSAKLYEDVSDMLDKTYRLNNGSINLGHLINGMIDISLEHGVKMPGSFFTLGKAIVTGEGLAKRLDPEINVVEVVKPLALEYLKGKLEPDFRPENVFRRTTEMLQTVSALPKDLAKIAGNLAKGELSIVFVHRGLENLYSMLDIVSTRLAVSLVVGAGIAGSAILLALEVGPKINGYSSLGMAGFSISSLLGLWMVWGMLRHGRLK
ncbi:ABC1 kinase family protein [Zhaonella formicivorans]|uniref:ABC1 kinase family protein n=1 Tax=Zhaonella formicivorans TaxID=2528593 RepID=UPI0010DB7093|nr:AarF/ABC1/UbiB kinase family protein [Zhaonella formicivorans]